jgi:hypothetical protein
MNTSRRDFVRGCLAGLGGVAAMLVAGRAWGDRRRILGGEGPASSPWATAASPELREFLGEIRSGPVVARAGLHVVWLAGRPASPLPVATLEEARQRGDLRIVEREQATVPTLIVENRGKSHVLLLAGEILLGGKQNRVLTEDVLLPPASGPRDIGVYCVEQGRWAGRSKEFEAKGSFAAPGLRSRVMEKADQGRVWAEVDRYARAAAAPPSPSRDYQAVSEQPEVKAHLEGVARELAEPLAGALGAAVFVGRALAGLDLFGDPSLFARQWSKLLRAQALDAYRRPAEPWADEKGLRGRVEELLRGAATAPGTARTNAGVGQLFESRVEGHRAAALVHAGRVVHVAIL